MKPVTAPAYLQDMEQNKQHRSQRNSGLKSIGIADSRVTEPPARARREESVGRNQPAWPESKVQLSLIPALMSAALLRQDSSHQFGGSSPFCSPSLNQQCTGGIPSSKQPTFSSYFTLIMPAS